MEEEWDRWIRWCVTAWLRYVCTCRMHDTLDCEVASWGVWSIPAPHALLPSLSLTRGTSHWGLCTFLLIVCVGCCNGYYVFVSYVFMCSMWHVGLGRFGYGCAEKPQPVLGSTHMTFIVFIHNNFTCAHQPLILLSRVFVDVCVTFQRSTHIFMSTRWDITHPLAPSPRYAAPRLGD